MLHEQPRRRRRFLGIFVALLLVSVLPSAEAHDDSFVIMTQYVVWHDPAGIDITVNVTATAIQLTASTNAVVAPSSTRILLYEHVRSGTSNHLTNSAPVLANMVSTPIANQFYYNYTVPVTGSTATTWVRGITYNVNFEWTVGVTTHSHTETMFIPPTLLYTGTNLMYFLTSTEPSFQPQQDTASWVGNTWYNSSAPWESRGHANDTWESQEHANDTWCPIVDCVSTIDGENFVTNDWANSTDGFERKARAEASRLQMNSTVAATFCVPGDETTAGAPPLFNHVCWGIDEGLDTFETQPHANDTWCPLPCTGGTDIYVEDVWFNATACMRGTDPDVACVGNRYANDTYCEKDAGPVGGCVGDAYFNDSSPVTMYGHETQMQKLSPFLLFVLAAILLVVVGFRFGAVFSLIGGVLAAIGAFAAISDGSSSLMISLLIVTALACFLFAVGQRRTSLSGG
jgi:hypothetical protein